MSAAPAARAPRRGRLPAPTLLAATLLAATLGTPLAAQAPAPPPLQVAELGACPLEGGDTIRDCRLGYRSWGRLNRRRDNAILLTTWFGGRSADLGGYVGPERLLDSARYFIVAIDAFGNGVSSSPSNSPSQPDSLFPRFTLRDVVRAQHRLLTERLGLTHLRAVTGLSMGGMQAFEWAVSYPGFMDRVVPIVGSPRLSAYDLAHWEAQRRAIAAARRAGAADSTALAIITAIQALTLQTPAYVNRTPPDSLPALLARSEAALRGRFRLHDWLAQLQAMMAHDVSAPFGGSLERAAAAVRAPLLVVVAAEDLTVNPAPALRFARLAGARTLVLAGDCGHLAHACERPAVVAAVREFLQP